MTELWGVMLGGLIALAATYISNKWNYDKRQQDKRGARVLDVKRLLARTLSNTGVVLGEIQVGAWDFKNKGGMLGGNTIDIPGRGEVYKDAWRRVDEWDDRFNPIRGTCTCCLRSRFVRSNSGMKQPRFSSLGVGASLRASTSYSTPLVGRRRLLFTRMSGTTHSKKWPEPRGMLSTWPMTSARP
jgi:hypothetical protein